MSIDPPPERDDSKAILFEQIAEDVFQTYGRTWKPTTLYVNQLYLRNQIMPAFQGRPVGEISRAEVRQWFAALHATPAAANRSLPILSIIMREAADRGHRPDGSNPCARIQRYPARRKERFLTPAEIANLGRALVAAEPSAPLQSTIIRLLALTGCRQSEIRTLRWRDYREGHLFLRDGKAGPRTVWLPSAARAVLNRLRDSARASVVFPATGRQSPISNETLYGAWRQIRAQAGLENSFRLHDLRHTYASFALGSGESVAMIGRLLGHRDPDTTLRYTHFPDAATIAAVESVADVLDTNAR